MYKIRLKLSYDGSAFNGWQKQTNKSRLTVQGCLEQALCKLFDVPHLQVVGAGRTDAGVHALAQQAHFVAPKDPSQYNLVKALNALTPPAMAIHEAWIAPENFHAQISAQAKTYKYLLLCSSTPSALRRHFVTWYPFRLDLDYLNECSQFLVKKQDFKSMQTKGTDVSSTIREISLAHWEALDAHLVQFTIHGSGFLKQMVRNIVGCLLDLHKNQRPPAEMAHILAARDRQAAGSTAPAQGLYLFAVHYPPELDNKCRKP